MLRLLVRCALLNSTAAAGMIAFAAVQSASAGTYTWSTNPPQGYYLGTWGVDTAGSPSVAESGQTGSGTLTLSGTNTYTGPTTVSGGTLQLGSVQIPPAGGTLTATGGTLDLNGFNAPQAVPGLSLTAGTLTLTGSNTYTGPTTISAGTLQLGNQAPWTVVPYDLSGSGTVTLTGSNTYTGSTTVSSGTLTLDNGNAALADSASATPAPLTPIPAGPVFYIIWEGAGKGDSVRFVPCTGKETVLSAIGAAGGISQDSSAKLWIARPTANDHGKSTILPINWNDISRRGIETTNYTLQPNDRLVLGEDPEVTRQSLLAKGAVPVERVLGIVNLTASAVQSLHATPGAIEAVKTLVDKGTFDDEPELKKVVLDMLRVADARPAAAPAQKEVKPTATAEKSVRDATAAEASPKFDLYLGYRSKEETPDGAKATVEPKRDEERKGTNAADQQVWTGTVTISSGTSANPAARAPTAQAAPHETAMRPLPSYRIEPPDVISVEMLKLIPLPPYRAAVFDVLQIRANATPDATLNTRNYYMVEAEGKIEFGQPWGALKVQGMTIDEIRTALDKMLETKGLRDPNSEVLLARVAGAQPVTGQYLVSPDGTINMRAYGQIRMALSSL